MATKAERQFIDKCKTFWEEADKDGNGLSVGELAKMIRQMGVENITDAQIAEMFLDIDDNNDKIISWDEYTDVFMKTSRKKVVESELRGAFKNLDKDGSGRLSAAEIKAQYAALEIDITDEQLENTISQADQDGDGNINYEEFLKAWGS